MCGPPSGAVEISLKPLTNLPETENEKTLDWVYTYLKNLFEKETK